MGRVLLRGLEADTVTSGAAGVQVAPVIRTKDEGVSIGVGEVLSHGGSLVDVVPAGYCQTKTMQTQDVTYTRPCVGSEIASWVHMDRKS